MASLPGLITADGTPLRRQAISGFGATAYRGADRRSSELASWVATLGSPDADLSYERDELVARSRDLLRNNGWARGLVDREVDSVIGQGLRLSALPDWRALGIEPDQSRKLADQIESLWREWTEDPRKMCDVSRRHGFGALQRLAYAGYFGADGEALAVLMVKPDRPFATAVQLVDPDRLSNPDDRPDERNLRSGVEIDDDGVPIAFHIRNAHPGEIWLGAMPDTITWQRVVREDEFGWPRVVHATSVQRTGQTRGIGALAAVLLQFKMLDSYQRMEMQAAVLNAVMAATIESPFDGDELREMFGDTSVESVSGVRTAFYDETAIKLNNVRVSHLFPGDKLALTQPTRPNSNFEAFEGAVLRHFAAGTGQTYEQVSMDWSKSNYSSARAALLEYWRGATARRGLFVENFVRPIYLAFLVGQFLAGTLKTPKGVPDIFDAPAAWTRARWIGPARGWVDPTKEAQGAILRLDGELSTLQIEAAEQGLDHEEVLFQRAAERDLRRRLGLPERSASTGARKPTPGAQTDEGEDQEAEEAEGQEDNR